MVIVVLPGKTPIYGIRPIKCRRLYSEETNSRRNSPPPPLFSLPTLIDNFFCSGGEARGRHGARPGDAMRAGEERDPPVDADPRESLHEDEREIRRRQCDHPTRDETRGIRRTGDLRRRAFVASTECG